MSFHNVTSCYDYKYTYLDVLHVGDYYMLTEEPIDTTTGTNFWRNVALTRYENGK